MFLSDLDINLNIFINFNGFLVINTQQIMMNFIFHQMNDDLGKMVLNPDVVGDQEELWKNVLGLYPGYAVSHFKSILE